MRCLSAINDMAYPRHRDVHVDAALSNFSVGYHPSGMVAEQVCPVIPVVKESDTYYIWDRQAAFQMHESLRADGARARTVDFGLTTTTYTAEEYALNTKVTEREKANADSVLRLRQSKSRRTQDGIYLGMEARVAALLTTSGSYASGHTGAPTAQWDASSGVDILKDLDTGKEAVRKAIGVPANVVVIPAAVANVIMRDSDILDLIKYTQDNLLVAGMLPPTLRGLRVIIPGATYTVSAEGATSPTYADIWGDNVIVLYDSGGASIDTPHFAKIFRSRPFRVQTWVEEAEANSEYIEVSVVQAEKLVSNVSGYLLTDVLE